MDPIRLLLVDDHEVVLRGLSDYFGSQPDMVVVGEARDASEALGSLASTVPDVAVLDLRLPDMDGISLCSELRARRPDLVCLMLSSFADETAVVDALLGGAAGYILKDAPLRDVSEAIRHVAAGESIVEPGVAERILARLRSGSAPAVESLTPQERRVLKLISQGLTNREIAERLFLAEQTVKNYVSSLLAKLGLKRRTQAATYAQNLDSNRASDRSL